MQLQDYYHDNDGDIHFSRQQGSNFAKEVAGDFNPLHNVDAKRFCIPGDLLFAVILSKCGLYQKMCFSFAGMVSDDIPLAIRHSADGQMALVDHHEKSYLSVEHQGNISHDPNLIRDLVCKYVTFSGHTFPHILVPLMREQDVMINTDRPLVIYESMAIDLTRLDITELDLELSNATLKVSGKRGDVCLEFQLLAAGEIVGHGKKNFVLSGLRPFDEDKVQQLVDRYEERKKDFQAE